MWTKYEINSRITPDLILEKGLEYKYNNNGIRVYASLDEDKNFVITKHSYDATCKEIFHFKLILNHKSIEQINKTIDFINVQENLQIPHLES